MRLAREMHISNGYCTCIVEEWGALLVFWERGKFWVVLLEGAVYLVSIFLILRGFFYEKI